MAAVPGNSPPAEASLEGFCTVAEAAKYLSLSRAKVYQIMDAGDLLYAKFGKARRIPRRALEEFAEGCIVGRGA